MYPRQPNSIGGWELEYKFLRLVQSHLDPCEDYQTVSMEEIESVLLAAEKAESPVDIAQQPHAVKGEAPTLPGATSA